MTLPIVQSGKLYGRSRFFKCQPSWLISQPLSLSSYTSFAVHAIPFYKKRSYEKRPNKFFNRMKQWPTEFSNIRLSFLLTAKKGIFITKKFQKDAKSLIFNLYKNKFKPGNINAEIKRNIKIHLKYRGVLAFCKNI